MCSRSQFRWPDGCCICGTKSSSSRFALSDRFCVHFIQCFGELTRNRRGKMCNACVLVVKRWLKMSSEKRAKKIFSQVVDSKCGPGPKHMKQITKLQKRRSEKTPPVSTTGYTKEVSNLSSSLLASVFTVENGFTRNNSLGSSAYCNAPLSTSTPSCGSSCSMRSITSDMISSPSGGTSSDSGLFRTPAPRLFNRRVHKRPLRITTNAFSDDMMREIMFKKGSDDVPDPMEINIIMQYNLRKRPDPNAALTNHDYQSVSSDSLGSSVGNIETLKN